MLIGMLLCVTVTTELYTLIGLREVRVLQQSSCTRLLRPACNSMHQLLQSLKNDLRPAQEGAAKHHHTPVMP